MHIHILGICGTFMGGIAMLARELGHRVTGSDANVYPPMSTQLQQQGIELIEGYDVAQLQPQPDLVVIGNAMSRGNPCVEHVLAQGIPYCSGPEWLKHNVLQQRWVLAVSGTHGKTTTTGMLSWILDYAGLKPGFLIGGVAQNFGISARLGDSPFFVIEADEYDSAFFDKRSKFVHYLPRTLIINNLEFDHADIFRDLADIQRQFHHLLRIVPQNGKVLYPDAVPAIAQTLAMGCWSEQEVLGAGGWQAQLLADDGSAFAVTFNQQYQGEVRWGLLGQHNVHNALMAIAAARHAGVSPEHAIAALAGFKAPKRRLEKLGEVAGITVYDDFAHHPTAIETTLDGLRRNVGAARIWAVLEPRSNTMKMGVYQHSLAPSLAAADRVILMQTPDVKWDLTPVAQAQRTPGRVFNSVDDIVQMLVAELQPGDQVLFMSNGGFGGIHQKLLQALAAK